MQDPSVDVVTPAGIAKFQDRLLKNADRTLQIALENGAQGMITWDPEGQEYPHQTSYLGDPRQLSPEFDAIADKYFAKFSKAGLRVGICVRPQKLHRTPQGGLRRIRTGWIIMNRAAGEPDGEDSAGQEAVGMHDFLSGFQPAVHQRLDQHTPRDAGDGHAVPEDQLGGGHHGPFSRHPADSGVEDDDDLCPLRSIHAIQRAQDV